MRITSKGQVTIPQGVREEAGLMPGTDVEFIVDRGAVKIVKARKRKNAKETAGQRLVARLRGSAQVKMSTEEIMNLLRGPAMDEE